ncbi:MAG: 50S ribosomal protein L30 [Alphaproteobacteria bacterium]|nr:50S ribosomal protein L30 [Alphaproteobacteria bacterium]MBL0718183.1 50S ribosomal protein L30 [Alphaproteobacteria bacterium]
MNTITVKQIKSNIGRTKKQIACLKGIGLNGKIGKTKTLVDSPEVQGMIRKVNHLIEIVESK